MDELDVWLFGDVPLIRRGEVVEDDDLFCAKVEQLLTEVSANCSCSAGDQDRLLPENFCNSLPCYIIPVSDNIVSSTATVRLIPSSGVIRDCA